MNFNGPVIVEVTEKDLSPEYTSSLNLNYVRRDAARAILKNQDKIALLFVSKLNYHKLPGGGVEAGENLKAALEREILEEAGCECEIERELGTTIEYRDWINVLQTSYIFVAHVVRKPKKPEFTDQETENGFQLKWVTIQEALDEVEKDKPLSHEGKFINLRDKKIIEFYLEQL